MLHGVQRLFVFLLIGSPLLSSTSLPTTGELTVCRAQCTSVNRTNTGKEDALGSAAWDAIVLETCMRACNKEDPFPEYRDLTNNNEAIETDEKRDDSSSLRPHRRESKFMRIGRDTSAVSSFFPAEPKTKSRRPPYLRIGRGAEDDDDSPTTLIDEEKRAHASRYVRIGRGDGAEEETLRTGSEEDKPEEHEEGDLSKYIRMGQNSEHEEEKRSHASRYVRIGRSAEESEEVKRAPASRYVRIGRGSDSEEVEEKRAAASRYVRIGRGGAEGEEEKRAPSSRYVRIGRGSNADDAFDKRAAASRYVRIGRDSNADDADDAFDKRAAASRYVRIGRGINADDADDAFDKRAAASRYVRIGRGDEHGDDLKSNDPLSSGDHLGVGEDLELLKRSNGHATRRQSKYKKIGKRSGGGYSSAEEDRFSSSMA